MRKTIRPRAAQAPSLTSGEIVVLAILLLMGALGTFLAQQHLAALRVVAEMQPFAEGGIAAAGESGRGSAGDVPDAPADVVLPEQPAPAVSAPAQSAAARRTQSLVAVGELMSRRILQPQPLAAAGRGGVGAPGFQIGADGVLPPSFGQLFGLSASEVQSLQETVSSIKQQIDLAIAANVSVERTEENAYRIDIRPVPEAQAFRDQFEAAFRNALGDERYRALALLNGEPAAGTRAPTTVAGTPRLTGIAAMLGGFGADAKTITVAKVPGTGMGPLGAQPRYNFQIRSGTTNGGGSGALALQNLDARAGYPVSKLLPPGF